MQFWNGFPLIDDDVTDGEIHDFMGVEGINYARGLVPRDYAQYPQTMFDPPDQMPIIPESEWDAWIDEQEAQQSSLEHIYLRGDKPAFVNLDQNGNGYCWAYSTGHAVMMARLRDNQPLIRLNPHSVAAIIKRGRDEGGWCGLSAQFYKEVGCAPEGTGPGMWPLHSRNIGLDTPEMRASMANFRIESDWVDLTQQVYDRNLTLKQEASCLLRNDPLATDYNWWGHSVAAIRFVRVERGSYGKLILNSWKGWGRFGLAVLRGSKMYSNGSICVRRVSTHGPHSSSRIAA